jgi:hypothetical protein
MTSTKKAATKKRSTVKSIPASGRPAAKAATKTTAKPKTSKTTTNQTKKAAPANDKPVQRTSPSPKELLQAGLSALSLPRAESAMADGLSKIADSFGFKKLEDVFDQRVASALERIGFPSVQELSRLVERVEALSALLQSQKTKARK